MYFHYHLPILRLKGAQDPSSLELGAGTLPVLLTALSQKPLALPPGPAQWPGAWEQETPLAWKCHPVLFGELNEPASARPAARWVHLCTRKSLSTEHATPSPTAQGSRRVLILQLKVNRVNKFKDGWPKGKHLRVCHLFLWHGFWRGDEYVRDRTAVSRGTDQTTNSASEWTSTTLC